MNYHRYRFGKAVLGCRDDNVRDAVVAVDQIISAEKKADIVIINKLARLVELIYPNLGRLVYLAVCCDADESAFVMLERGHDGSFYV